MGRCVVLTVYTIVYTTTKSHAQLEFKYKMCNLQDDAVCSTHTHTQHDSPHTHTHIHPHTPNTPHPLGFANHLHGDIILTTLTRCMDVIKSVKGKQAVLDHCATTAGQICSTAFPAPIKYVSGRGGGVRVMITHLIHTHVLTMTHVHIHTHAHPHPHTYIQNTHKQTNPSYSQGLGIPVHHPHHQ